MGHTSYKISYSMNLNVKPSRNSFLNLNKDLPKTLFYNELFISSGKPDLNVCSRIPNDLVNFL